MNFVSCIICVRKLIERRVFLATFVQTQRILRARRTRALVRWERTDAIWLCLAPTFSTASHPCVQSSCQREAVQISFAAGRATWRPKSEGSLKVTRVFIGGCLALYAFV